MDRSTAGPGVIRRPREPVVMRSWRVRIVIALRRAFVIMLAPLSCSNTRSAQSRRFIAVDKQNKTPACTKTCPSASSRPGSANPAPRIPGTPRIRKYAPTRSQRRGSVQTVCKYARFIRAENDDARVPFDRAPARVSYETHRVQCDEIQSR